MSRKPQFDHQEAIKLYKEGNTISALAEKYHVTRTAIQKAVKDVAEQPKTIRHRKHNGDGLKELSLADLDKISLEMYKRASQYPELIEQINRLRNQLATANNRIKILEADKQERLNREREFDLAKKDGKTFPNLTEHIPCAPLDFTYDLNIIKPECFSLC